MRGTPRVQRSLRYLLAWAPTVAMPRAMSAQRPVPDAALESGTLSFFARATAGDFVGTTSKVTGAIIGGRDYSTTRGWIEAPVRSLVTGNERRDRELRESMEVDRYPTVRFDLNGATFLNPSFESPDSSAMVLHGALTIHGVTRHVDVVATVQRCGDTTHVTTRFPIDLADYRIGGLTKMLGLLRMDREVDVLVDLRFFDTPTLWAIP
jgi:polyisoprenoid-binding protein YceI